MVGTRRFCRKIPYSNPVVFHSHPHSLVRIFYPLGWRGWSTNESARISKATFDLCHHRIHGGVETQKFNDERFLRAEPPWREVHGSFQYTFQYIPIHFILITIQDSYSTVSIISRKKWHMFMAQRFLVLEQNSCLLGHCMALLKVECQWATVARWELSKGDRTRWYPLYKVTKLVQITPGNSKNVLSCFLVGGIMRAMINMGWNYRPTSYQSVTEFNDDMGSSARKSVFFGCSPNQ